MQNSQQDMADTKVMLACFARLFGQYNVLVCFILARLGKSVVDFKVCRTQGNWRCECGTLKQNVNSGFSFHVTL